MFASPPLWTVAPDAHALHPHLQVDEGASVALNREFSEGDCAAMLFS